MRRLHALWFQVTGLLCNLQCTHCLVDSSPGNDSLEFLDPGTVRRALAEAESLGVKEVYFTGGEPFLHRQLLTMLADALAVAPTTVLTNGTLVTERLAAGLAELAGRARYSLEIRVSLDHPDPARNDSVRGAGAHFKALRAVVRLDRAGLAPIVTATEYLLAPRRAGEGGSTYDAFLACLGEAGIRRPRLKILPVFHTGKLEDPTRGGAITEAMLRGIDASSLQCSESRVVAADGVYACPILVGKPSARIAPGTALTGGLGPVELAHHACRTCYETGMTCGNY
jgi:sulfatase maturation enzyme AslB (radical SAM superfamily)